MTSHEMRPIYIIWVPWKFSSVPEYAHGYFSRNFNGLLFRSILWMCVQSFKFVAFPVPEIIGGTSKIWAVSGHTHAPISPNFLMPFVRMGPLNVPAKFEVCGFTKLPIPDIINSNWSLGGVANSQSWGRGGCRRSGMVPFETVLVISYRASIVTFPLSLRVSEISPLLCSSTPLFPTPPLVSPKFSHVPPGLGGWPLGYEERRRWANCSCN